MKTNRNSGASLGVLTAIAASLCCIAPVLAVTAGISGIASSFSWLEPFRPYLVGLSVITLGFAWYQKLKTHSDEETACACEENPSFWQSKRFLAIITVVAGALLFFPAYSGAFLPGHEKQAAVAQDDNLQVIQLSVQGMTCTGCEEHVRHTALSSGGVVEATASYREGKAIVKFDRRLTNAKRVGHAIEAETGYRVTQPPNNK